MAALTPSQTRRKKHLAEKLKGKPGVDNPFALATHIAKRKPIAQRPARKRKPMRMRP